MGSSPLGWSEIFGEPNAGFDSLVPFLGVAQMLASQAEVVVEVGCGRGAVVESTAVVENTSGRASQDRRAIQDLRGTGRRVIGIDVDPAGVDNPAVDEF